MTINKSKGNKLFHNDLRTTSLCTMMLSMQYDYRKTLLDEFEERCVRNPSYTLRSFARDLDISPSRISEIFNKKRGTSLATGIKICKQLNYKDRERELFLLSIVVLHSRSKNEKRAAFEKLTKINSRSKENEIDLERFKVIANWYHYAILELLESSISVNSIEDISQKLGLSEIQSKVAIERLLKVGLIKKNETFFETKSNHTFTTNDVPSKSLKDHQNQIIGLSQKALYEQSVDNREMASTTLAFNKSKMSEAKKIIRECRRKLGKICNGDDNKDSVYVFNTQFFQLDRE